jgi:hypothetical protein
MKSKEYTEYSLMFKENFSWEPIELRLETIFMYLKEKMKYTYFKDKEYVSIEKIFLDLIPMDNFFFISNRIKIQKCIRDIAFLNSDTFILSKDEKYVMYIDK